MLTPAEVYEVLEFLYTKFESRGIANVSGASKHESGPFCSSAPRNAHSSEPTAKGSTLLKNFSDFSFTTNELRKSSKMRPRSGCVVFRDMQSASDNRLQ